MDKRNRVMNPTQPTPKSVVAYKIKAMKRIFPRTVALENGCIEWTGPTNWRGYGTTHYNDGLFKSDKVHRVFYYLQVGIIPPLMTIDHMCNNTKCVNVEHMQLATRADNTRRRNKDPSMIEYCKRGHHLAGDNLIITWRGRKEVHVRTRKCRACHNEEARLYRAKKKSELTKLKKGNH